MHYTYLYTDTLTLSILKIKTFIISITYPVGSSAANVSGVPPTRIFHSRLFNLNSRPVSLTAASDDRVPRRPALMQPCFGTAQHGVDKLRTMEHAVFNLFTTYAVDHFSWGHHRYQLNWYLNNLNMK